MMMQKRLRICCDEKNGENYSGADEIYRPKTGKR